jgi:hypothetical protein
MLDRAVAIYQRSQVPGFRAPVTSEEFMAAAGRAAASAPDPVRRLANLALSAHGWCPTMKPRACSLDGRRYVDGGLRSPFNADLAAGHEVVIVLSPLRTSAHLQRLLEAEIASLAGATVHVVMADDTSLVAIGPDLLSTETAEAAVDAGRAQAARECDALKSIWQSGEHRPE